MAAARPAPLLAIAALCLAAAAASATRGLPADAAPLRALRSEEGSIDDLISRIEQLQEQKRQQHQKSAERRPPAVRPASSHPVRKFAYYPSDPEYRAPPAPPAAAQRDPPRSTPGRAGPGSGPTTGDRHAAAAGTSAGPTPARPAVTARARGDPEEVSHEQGRQKKASADTRVVRVDADTLLSPAPIRDNTSDVYFIVTVAGICAVAVGVTVAGGFCYHRLQKRAKAAGDAEYPAYGVTGPNRDLSPSGDRKLAQSAQMYHYQHQKQQMMAMEKTHNGRHGSASDVDSEEENEEGDYTVYECPGLAPTGEMEVKNPLFQDDQTPAPPAAADTNGK